ncbi:MAG TPA: hypothetical protein VLX58_11250 [Bryobacteraceae bacterium]|nr:hypothetical protein [Bryobacteraceae bacterium]
MQLGESGHATEESLEKYAMDLLTDPELSAVEEHLLACSHCQERLHEVDGYVKAIRAAASGMQQEDEARKRSWTRISAAFSFRGFGWVLAASALVLIGLALRIARNPSTAPQPAAVFLQTSRGVQAQQAPAGRPLELALDMRGLPLLPAYTVETVDGDGKQVAKSDATASQDVVKATVSIPLRAGNYFIRLYAPSGELLREYGLRVR